MSGVSEQPGVRSVTILGSKVDLQPLDEALKRVDRWVENPDGRCHRIVVTGFHGLWEASRSTHVREVLNSADLWVPDGIAPVWIARLRGHRKVQRIPGADLMCAIFEQGRSRGYRHFFYGDTPEVCATLSAVVESAWPGNIAAGSISPPFRDLSPGEIDADIDAINASEADFLWVALGMPKQDLWIHEHRERLQIPVAVGVGAAFLFVAGIVKRAPAWIGRSGLEWVYRLLKEPRKCWRRSLVDGPQFIMQVLREQSALRRSR